MNKTERENLISTLDLLENFLNELLDPNNENVQPCYNSELKSIRDSISSCICEFKTAESVKPTKTKKHSWFKNEDGEIDNWQYTYGEYHNGPACEICGYGFCHHCKNEYDDDESCVEHYICECGNHLKGNEKYCDKCGRTLDWSNK